MRLLKEHGLFVLLFTLCFVLRFIPLFDYQFTFDELSGLDRTQFNSTAEVLEKGVKIDAHPALVQLMIYWMVCLFGYVNWIIKLPFLLFSLGAVLYAYLFGLRFFSKQSGLFAAAVLSFSLVFVFYAPIARMYIAGVFFSIGLLFHFYKIFFSESAKIRDYFGVGIFSLLSAFNQHVNGLYAFTVCLSGLFFLSSKTWKPYLLTCILTIVLYLPHLPITLYQLSVPGIGRDSGGWLEPPEWSVIISFLRVLFGTGYVFVFLLAAFVYAIGQRSSHQRPGLILLILFIVNYLVIYFYSLFKSPIYQHSVMLFSCTGLVLYVSGVLQFEKKPVFYFIFSVTSLLLILQTYVVKDYLNQSVKTVYEYQFERTAELEKTHGKEKVTAVFFDCDTLMRKIYYNKYKSGYALKIAADSIVSNSERIVFENGKSSIRLFSEYIAGLKSDYLALASSTPLYERMAEEKFPFLIENTQTQGIYYKVFSKQKPRLEDSRDVLSRLPDELSSGTLPVVVDSINEFPLGVKCDARKLRVTPGYILLVETALSPGNKNTFQVESVISLTDTLGQTFSYGARQLSDFNPEDSSRVTMYSEHFLGTAYELHYTEAKLNCYLWNKAKASFIIRDQKFSLIDYWHAKWNYWK